MNSIMQKNFTKAIIYTKFLDDASLLVVDKNTSVRFINIKDMSISSGFKANITHERYSSNKVYFSSDAKYFISCSADNKEAKFYNTETKKIIAKIDRHKGEVSCVGIDPNNRYIFTGGDDGRTFGVDIKSGKLAFALPNHIDTINDIAFSANAQWVATASFDKKISLFNLAMMTPKFRLKAHSAPVMKLEFLSKLRLISIDKKNSAIIWNIHTGKVITRLNGIHDDITQITQSHDNEFLFLGTKLGYILVYELKSYKLITARYIKLKTSITSLSFYEKEQYLIIGTDNGDLLVYNIFEGEEYLSSLLKDKKYNQMQEYVEVNPLLVYTKPYLMVDILWKKTIDRAKELLGNSEKEKALAIFKNFKNIPIKNQLIQKLMKEYLLFDKFVLLVKQNKLALAYGLANQYPEYKDSKLYKSLEIKWKKLFALAQKYLLEPNSADMARDILSIYRGVPAKTKLVNDLFSNILIYKRFRDFIVNKNFKMSFKLIEKNQFLLETNEYISIMDYADQLYLKSNELIGDGDTHSAIKLLKILEDFSDYKEEADELILDIENRENFFNAVDSKNMADAYNILSVSECLQTTEDGLRLNKLWEDDVDLANSYAAKGNIVGVSKSLYKYKKITSKNMFIASIFSWSYISQLESAIKQKKGKLIIEKGIKNYLFYFGEQEQIINIFDLFKKYYPETKLDFEYQKKGSLSMWRPAMIVKSILD